MAYSELIKDISRIREYMREFFVYGFKSREEIGGKSARSYDNERRRIESWLGDNMSFRQDVNGKNVFISVDSRRVPQNPLYQAWRAASFTKNDITLHFWLLDILSSDKVKSLTEIIETIDRDYLPLFENADPIDESTLRKKLKEYVDIGLIIAERQGRQLVYKLSVDNVDLQSWSDAIAFFAEENPLGVVGSFLQDKFSSLPQYISFKSASILGEPRREAMLTFELTDERNALERVMLHFADCRKETRRIDSQHYHVALWYDPQDNTEILIRILSFGQMIRVTSPESFIDLIKERVIKQQNFMKN